MANKDLFYEQIIFKLNTCSNYFSISYKIHKVKKFKKITRRNFVYTFIDIKKFVLFNFLVMQFLLH